MCKFLRESSFSSYIQQKNRKIINSTYLVSVGCGRLGEGLHFHGRKFQSDSIVVKTKKLAKGSYVNVESLLMTLVAHLNAESLCW